MYVTHEELTRLIVEAQETGRIGDRLAAAVDSVLRGYCERYARDLDPDDVAQYAWLRVLLALPRMRTTGRLGRPFSYLTCIAQTAAMYLRRVERRHRAESLDAAPWAF